MNSACLYFRDNRIGFSSRTGHDWESFTVTKRNVLRTWCISGTDLNINAHGSLVRTSVRFRCDLHNDYIAVLITQNSICYGSKVDNAYVSSTIKDILE